MVLQSQLARFFVLLFARLVQQRHGEAQVGRQQRQGSLGHANQAGRFQSEVEHQQLFPRFIATTAICKMNSH